MLPDFFGAGRNPDSCLRLICWSTRLLLEYQTFAGGKVLPDFVGAGRNPGSCMR